MITADDVLRAQARALVKVLAFYHVNRIQHQQFTSFRGNIEAYGNGETGALDFVGLLRKFHDAAFEAGIGNMHRKWPGYALVVALYSFCQRAPVFRFLEPAKSIALAVELLRQTPKPFRILHREVFERLEDAFDAEINADVSS
jgi:hypothetical protein